MPILKESDSSGFYCGALTDHSEHWFFSRSFICGEETKGLFKKLLGLSADSRILLNTMIWNGNYFEIKLLDKYAKESYLAVVEHYKKDKHWLYDKYRSAILPNGFIILSSRANLGAQAKKALSSLARNLSKIKPSDLFDTAYNDNNMSVKENRQLKVPPGEVRPYCGLFDEWGDERMKHTFMLNYSLLERITQVKLGGDKSVFLRCGDVECNNMYHPFNFFDSFFMFNTYGRYVPQMEHIFQNDRGQLEARIKGGRLFRDIVSRFAAIEAKENDIILGFDAKVYDILDKLTVGKTGVPLFILCSCISKVIGSDIDSLARKVNRKNSALIVCDQNIGCAWGQDLALGMLINPLKNYKAHTERTKRINLIGFEKDQALDELVSLLNNFFKIELNLVFLPEVDLCSLNSYYRAGLQVLNRVDAYDKAFHGVFRKLKIDTIELAPPYGMKRSLDWIKSIANFFKTPAAKNKSWKDYYDHKAAEWLRLTQEAGRFRLGLIISEEDVEFLADPQKYPFGIPLLFCLEEMGFALDILFTSGDDFEDNKKRILELLENKQKHKVELLNNNDGLEEWIGAQGRDCIYSDIRDDARIMASGKTAFSFFIFERGFEGALRTLKELLRLCRITYFRKYRSYAKMLPQPVEIE